MLTKINKGCIGIQMKRVNFHLEERHIEYLKRLRKLAGIPASETLRRMLDEKIESSEALEKAEKETNSETS